MCEPINNTYSVSLIYKTIRKNLDNLGYVQPLPLDALPLVQKLLADLIQTTESLRHFKSIAENNIENTSQSDFFIEPYKHDNIKLTQEYNNLGKELIEVKDHNLKVISELKRKINRLENECNDLQLASSKNLKKLKDLEIESSNKSKRIQELLGKCCKPTINNIGLAAKKRTVFPLKKPTLEVNTLSLLDINDFHNQCFVNLSKIKPHVVNVVQMAEKRINSLLYDVQKLKDELTSKTDNLSLMKTQLAVREQEISRLKKLIETGRPHSVLSTNCKCIKNSQACSHCYLQTHNQNSHNFSSSCNNKMSGVNEMRILQQAKSNLEQQLRDALDKQHDAMSQAMKLAERNEELEKELKDIDNIALAVEADCNIVVKENNKKIGQLQDKLEKSLKQISDLENNLLVEKRMCQELRADVEAAKNEKRNIQRTLDNTLEENKQLINKINNCNNIDTNLKNEVEKLSLINFNQKKKFDKLKLLAKSMNKQLDAVKKSINKSIIRVKKQESKIQGEKVLTIKRIDSNMHSSTFGRVFSAIETEEFIKMQNEKIKKFEKTISNLEREKNHFKDEWNKFKDQQRDTRIDNGELYTQIGDLKHQLSESEVKIIDLKRENTELNYKKLDLENRYRMQTPQINNMCGQSMCHVLAQQQVNATSDNLERIIQERDIIREKLRLATEAHTMEQKGLRGKIQELEMKLDNADEERNNILISQRSQQTTFTELEEITKELQRTKQKLVNQQNQYSKLRTLQEHTDQTLSDVQNKLTQSELELSRILNRNRILEQQNVQLSNQIKNLNQDINNLQSNMTRLHASKDQLVLKLDEKTEKIADLERELVFKQNQIHTIEQQLRSFEHKNQLCVDQNAGQERRFRDLQMEIDESNRQLLTVLADRDSVTMKNEKLQDDLAALTCEYKNLQRELEDSKRESSDLKTQLQTYVNKVRCTEDLINLKEKERSEMLNQYKNLTLEASVLENDKHSLESEAAQVRGALQSATDRLVDLERDLANKNCLITGYENKIAELSKIIAKLETNIRQQADQKNQTEIDINGLRDLCAKLEKQRETHLIELGQKNTRISYLEEELARFNSEHNINYNQKARDQATIDRLQSLLEKARREDIEHQQTNQELLNKIERLKQKIVELQNELSNEAAELKRWQNQAVEYNNQMCKLRRTVTDERFDRARKDEEQRNLIYSSKHIQSSSIIPGEQKTTAFSTRSDLTNSPLELQPSSPSDYRGWLRLPFNAYPKSSSPQESSPTT